MFEIMVGSGGASQKSLASLAIASALAGADRKLLYEWAALRESPMRMQQRKVFSVFCFNFIKFGEHTDISRRLRKHIYLPHMGVLGQMSLLLVSCIAVSTENKLHY